MKWKSTLTWIALSTLAVIIIPTIFYVIKFGNWRLSNDVEQWAHLATYLTAFASIANLIVVYGIAKEANSLSLHTQRENKLFQEAYERPLLYLTQRLQSEAWYITNVGRGAALNIKIGIEFSQWGADKAGIKAIVKGYSLSAGKDSLIVKSDFRGIVRFFVLYEDVRQNKFISVANNHETITRELDEFAPITFDDEYEFTEADLKALDKIPLTNPKRFSQFYQTHIYPADQQ